VETSSRTVFPQKAIPRATLLLLRRSAGPLLSIVLAGDGDGRGAQLLGGRACLALGRRSRSSFVSPAAFSSPARVRSRVCSSSFGGGARLCPGDFGVAEELTALWNKVSWPCLRPDGVLLRRLRRGRRVMHRRPGLALHRLCQVTFVLPFLLLLDSSSSRCCSTSSAAATMPSTEVSRRCQGSLCNFSFVWASL